jgi:hypothetical protein
MLLILKNSRIEDTTNGGSTCVLNIRETQVKSAYSQFQEDWQVLGYETTQELNVQTQIL